MARLTHRLTAVAVANLKGKGLYPDGNGLYLRVTDSGTKSWIWRFKRDGTAHDMGLGPLSNVTLAQARALAAEARQQRHGGVDPIEARKARTGAKQIAGARPTFRDCAEKLIGSYEASWRNAKHRAQWSATIKTYAYPVIGDLPVTAINTNLVLEVLEPIWFAKTETAGRVRGRIEAVLDWAKARGLREGQNPAQWRGHLDHLLPARSKVRRVQHHPALPYAEAPAFMGSLRARSGITPRALEFVILTASRTGEALGARFDEIDVEGALWTVPAERMKSAREHRVTLSPRAIAIVQEMEAIRLNEYVFPGMKQGRSLSDMALLMLLRELRPGITTHGFRSTFKDWASEATTFPDHVSEAALAHVSADKVRAAYARSDLLDKRRKLMEAWASFCGRKAGDVVQLRRKAI